nr:DUF4198 domain-containing protein [Roseobacter sp.]
MIKRLFLLTVLVQGFPALAHEFWIEPQQYQVESGNELVADLKNGENFEGVSLGWFEKNFSRFEIVSGNEVMPVPGRAGDFPAMAVEAPGEGLVIILHETTPASLKYNEWQKFLNFAEHKGFDTAEARHIENGWPQEGFRESYTRHAKALVAVGDGAGSDRAFGLETEIVALANPYDAGFDGRMPVRVHYQGAPRAGAQVEVFDRAPDGSVTVSLAQTDEAGEAEIAVTPGHDYLLDAVVLRESPKAGTAEDAPVWETLWAALTFSVPQ